MKASCDLCNAPIKWKQVVIAFRNDNGTLFVKCMDCVEQYEDKKIYPNKNWEVHIFGDTLTWNDNSL